MTPQRWQRIEELFRTVAERPLVERESYLTSACADDEDLRREVLELLAHQTAESFLDNPIKHAAHAVTDAPASEFIGQRVGPYRLTRLIGRGGMGTVYEAVRDDDEFQQQVAIKLIKHGMDSAFVRERFLRERQILASLDHPHIARLLDGGTTTEGQPYFVMELVTGEPITAYCNQRRLSLEEKLKLFRDVCAAVQHAHQKLVVHRDLKPSNILVNAQGSPKLLDFGIAKLLAPDPGEAITSTESAVRLMTPDYASPEQLRGGTITTATDVYSLGVVLYELLTARRPFQFETHAPLEIARIVCDTEAPRPSDILEGMRDSKGMRDEGGGMRFKRIFSSLIPHPSSLLRGDLDNIVLMALRKEPERRYQSVEQFSDDLQRYLNGLPVQARADTFAYRARKFVGRNRVAVTAATLVLLSLLGGILMTTRAARQARAERERAERRFAQVRKLSNTFLFDFDDKLQDIPGTTETRALVAKTALEYLNSLEQEAAGDAQLEWELASAYQKVGDVQGAPWSPNLGQTQEAKLSYQKSLKLAQQLNQNGNSDLKMLRLLAQDYFKLGALQTQAGEVTVAHETLRQALSVAERLEQQTHDLEDIRLLQSCHIRLGDTLMDAGDPTGALESYRRTLRLSERRVREFPSDRSQLSLGMDYERVAEAQIALGDLPGALAGLQQSLTQVDAVLPRHATDPIYLRPRMIALGWLGDLSGNPNFLNFGDTAAALRYNREALVLAEQMAALDAKNARAQRDLASQHFSLAEMLTLAQPAQAIAHLQQARAIVRELLVSEPQSTELLRQDARCLKGLAKAHAQHGEQVSALQELQQARQILQALQARDANDQPTRDELHDTLLTLAELTLRTGAHNAALPLYREALTLAQTPPVEQSAAVMVRWHLADSYAGLSRYYAARAAGAPLPERPSHWRDARQYAQQSLSLWEGWGQHAPSTSFDRRQREQAARAVAVCDAALAKLAAAKH